MLNFPLVTLFFFNLKLMLFNFKFFLSINLVLICAEPSKPFAGSHGKPSFLHFSWISLAVKSIPIPISEKYL